MMVKFTHYLVTRFNVPVENWDKDKAGRPTLNEPWMTHRLWLFRKYCVPTITGQICHNFQWVIYCDVNTSFIKKTQIEESIRMIPGTVIRLAAHQGEMMADLRKLISGASTPYVITTRLDNDDGMGENLIQNVQNHFKEVDKLLLNPSSGILYDINEKVMTRMRNSKRNHYTSLIEKNNNAEDLLTVLGFPHDNPPAGVIIENIAGDRAWLKIIHEKNIKSQLKGRPVFAKKNIYFNGIKNSEFHFSFVNTMKYTLRRLRAKFLEKKNVTPLLPSIDN
ncbi:MAG: glycosyltransferase [Saprospiraceae bacterium]